MKKTQVGHINFLNCLPLSYSFLKQQTDDLFTVTRGVPSELNYKITHDELDISPVSAIVYARNSEKLMLLPNLSISIEGAIRSLIIESKRPIEQLDGAHIGLTAKSENTHCVVKILLEKGYGIKPRYTVDTIQPNEVGDYDATLLIGDDALYTYHHKQEGYYYYDVGSEWRKMTGLPLVCAVWTVREEFAKENPALVAKIAKRLSKGFEFGLRHKEVAIATMNDGEVYSDVELSEYLGLLNWGFSPRHQQALEYMYQMAYELDLVPCVPKIKIAEVTSL
ncbi:MAG: menaquinone biosynthesis protein [Selenomonadales bacterium]|nr:menaquinone biosynthesis protein [Selenomonadales bacterium]MBQ2114090.1 menaquinone biosynthesis protein [Selenomonadales bacterium]MBQ2246457.1 menaquinone biosynthesis protein [Selenomonadales bacterium]MBQ5587854.1 menaquinone biosynthesis protein [Selenomonadales bacterium]MBQ5636251.1 menaquinone biosynthesis protein [Selenomonadales bacterium]